MTTRRTSITLAAVIIFSARTGFAQERRDQQDVDPSCTRTYVAAQVSEAVARIVVEHLGVDPAKVDDSSYLVRDLGADSLDSVELVMALEEAFCVEIPDDVADRIETVGNLKAVARDRLGTRLRQ